MSELIKILLIFLAFIVGGYLVGRSLTKGVLKELDLYLGRKFTNYVNKKQKKHDNNEEEKKQF